MTIAADGDVKPQNKQGLNTVPAVSLKPATPKFFVLINGCKVVHCTNMRLQNVA